MNVKELIKELEKQPHELDVRVDIDWKHMKIEDVNYFPGNISTKERYVLLS